MNKCKFCGANSEGEFCFKHKKRTPLSKGTRKKKTEGMQDFFMHIWNTRIHRCENCNVHLGSEPLSYMFDHVLEKSKYPDLKYEEENICMLCLDCHSNKTNCKLSDFIKEKIKKVKEIFEK